MNRIVLVIVCSSLLLAGCRSRDPDAAGDNRYPWHGRVVIGTNNVPVPAPAW